MIRKDAPQRTHDAHVNDLHAVQAQNASKSPLWKRLCEYECPSFLSMYSLHDGVYVCQGRSNLLNDLRDSGVGLTNLGEGKNTA